MDEEMLSQLIAQMSEQVDAIDMLSAKIGALAEAIAVLADSLVPSDEELAEVMPDPTYGAL